ncbi:sigma factor [Catenulispora subtropica]|uniref:RNA polymerase sigma-70 region 2 domain-containing protein n=1 Tax=Catenulispora subtropica TaxID=450798 RepID=A0ABP5EZ95_9ACTN
MKGTADGEEFTNFVSRNWKQLVQRYAPYVDGNYADAEDLVQEAMIDLARQWHEVDTPKAWIHRHCERGAIRVISRHQHPVRGALALDQSYAESLPADSRNPAADSDAYMLAQELVSSSLEWTMLNLHADGYTHAEIVKSVKDHPIWARRRMGCTTSNVGKVLRREKERLARKIRHRLRTRERATEGNREMIMTAVLALPKKQREAFGLRLLGFEPLMIARKMGTKPMNARANLSHANKKLADVFGLDYEDATAVPQFVDGNLSLASSCIMLGAALAERSDLSELIPLSDRPRDTWSSINGAVIIAAAWLGTCMVKEKVPPSQWIPALPDKYLVETLVKAVADAVAEKLNSDGDVEASLSIPLPMELKAWFRPTVAS